MYEDDAAGLYEHVVKEHLDDILEAVLEDDLKSMFNDIMELTGEKGLMYLDKDKTKEVLNILDSILESNIECTMERHQDYEHCHGGWRG